MRFHLKVFSLMRLAMPWCAGVDLGEITAPVPLFCWVAATIL